MKKEKQQKRPKRTKAQRVQALKTFAVDTVYDVVGSILCCFSKRMRKVFRKNEKSMLQNCNKKAKRKGRLQRVKKPM